MILTPFCQKHVGLAVCHLLREPETSSTSNIETGIIGYLGIIVHYFVKKPSGLLLERPVVLRVFVIFCGDEQETPLTSE